VLAQFYYFLFLPIIIANPIDETDNTVAVRNIRLYAAGLGNAPAAAAAAAADPLIFNICCWDCIGLAL
jgi:hypothetical protein